MLFDIIDYLGKHDEGILVLISLNYDNNYYDSTLYYKDNFITLTIDEDLELKIGSIEEWIGYNNLILDIMKKVIPYDEIINRLDVIDLSGYIEEKGL